ncbi:unnamed protein product [Urochloa humidicola]
MCTDEPLSGPDQSFSDEEWKKITGGRKKFDKGIILSNFMVLYRRAVNTHQVKVEKLEELGALVDAANRRAEQGKREAPLVDAAGRKARLRKKRQISE